MRKATSKEEGDEKKKPSLSTAYPLSLLFAIAQSRTRRFVLRPLERVFRENPATAVASIGSPE